MTPSVTASLIFSYLLVVVRIGLIVAGCTILYRALRLVALPWIAAWYAVGLVTDSATAYYFHQIMPLSWVPASGEPLPGPLSALTMAADLAIQLSSLLVVLLIFAEAAFVLQRLKPDSRSGPFYALAGIHRYIRQLGIAALAFAVVAPCVPMVYYYAHGHH
jgi:hypothetical protein